jgi:hypothetical protein
MCISALNARCPGPAPSGQRSVKARIKVNKTIWILSVPFQLVSLPRGRGSRSSAYGPLAPTGWRLCGAELSAGGGVRVSSLAPASLRTASAWARSAETDGSLVFFPPPPRTQVLAPVPPGTLSGRKPEGMDEPQPHPAHFTSPNLLPRGWTWRPGAKDCELGWPEEPELALVTSWAASPFPHPQVF